MKKNLIKIMPSLKWPIIKSVPAYSNISKRCQLCLQEKFEILYCPNPNELLTKRSEHIHIYIHIIILSRINRTTMSLLLKVSQFFPDSITDYTIGRALLLYIQHNMEKLNYNCSFKNIPTPIKTSYQLTLIEKIESVIKRIQCDNKVCDTKTSFRIKSRYHPPPCTELEHFEKGLINIINNIKFTNNTNSFQKTLPTDITEIKNSRNICLC